MFNVPQKLNFSIEKNLQTLASDFTEIDNFDGNWGMIAIIRAPEDLARVSTTESIQRAISIILDLFSHNFLKRLGDLSVIVIATHLIITSIIIIMGCVSEKAAVTRPNCPENHPLKYLKAGKICH
jgi:hypothetical protein